MADLALPTAFCRSPLASCILPLPLSAESSVASPTPCFTFPATWFAVPLTLSDVLLIAFSLEMSQFNAPTTSPLPPGPRFKLRKEQRSGPGIGSMGIGEFGPHFGGRCATPRAERSLRLHTNNRRRHVGNKHQRRERRQRTARSHP